MKPIRLMAGMFLSGVGAAIVAALVWMAPGWPEEYQLKSQRPAGNHVGGNDAADRFPGKHPVTGGD